MGSLLKVWALESDSLSSSIQLWPFRSVGFHMTCQKTYNHKHLGCIYGWLIVWCSTSHFTETNWKNKGLAQNQDIKGFFPNNLFQRKWNLSFSPHPLPSPLFLNLQSPVTFWAESCKCWPQCLAIPQEMPLAWPHPGNISPWASTSISAHTAFRILGRVNE